MSVGSDLIPKKTNDRENDQTVMSRSWPMLVLYDSLNPSFCYPFYTLQLTDRDTLHQGQGRLPSTEKTGLRIVVFSISGYTSVSVFLWGATGAYAML